MATNRIYILHLVTILLILISCTNKQEVNSEVVMLKVGNFTLSKAEFDDAILKLEEINPNLSKEELGLMVFDNFIGAGLMIESAKKHHYIQRKEFKDRYEKEFQKPLIIKHNQFLRTGRSNKGYINYNKILDYKDKGLNVDYVRIPKGQKSIAKKMFGFFKSGASYSDIKENPEYGQWKSLGVSFHEGVPLCSAIFTRKIFNEIETLNENDVKFIKEHASYYVLRMKQSGELPYGNKDKKIHLLNTIMAQCLENGDSVFDRFILENLIKCNYKLLSAINFSIPPLISGTNCDDEVIADLNGEKIFVHDVKQIINGLPIKFQSLFYNKSTRKQAIATLILINFQSNGRAGPIYFKSQKSELERGLKHELAEICPNDTVEFIKKWIINNLDRKKSDPIADIVSQSIKIKNVTPGKNIKLIDDWLTPEKYLNSNELKLNYRAIESMNFQQDISGFENMDIAKSENWHLNVRDLNNELKKLSPETRIDIATNNLSVDLIKYLAMRDTKTKNIHMAINTILLDKIDIAGNSYDDLKIIVNEADTVGSLKNIFLTVKDIRQLFYELPKQVKEKVFSDFEMRKKVFSEILVEQFWLNFYDPETLKDDTEYLREEEQCQNKILVELFYNNEIKVPSFKIDNNVLNVKYNEALQIVNNDRLCDFLKEAASYFPIEVNTRLLKDKYRFILSSSRFFNSIHEYKQ